jgi:hypothetical protein
MMPEERDVLGRVVAWLKAEELKARQAVDIVLSEHDFNREAASFYAGKVSALEHAAEDFGSVLRGEKEWP